MLALYRRLLRLYPPEYFREYSDEMISVFRQAQEAARQEGMRRRALFCIRELSGVLAGAYCAQYRGFAWNPFRRFEMRSEFRFPRMAIAMMALVLSMVVITIDKAADVSRNHFVGVDLTGAGSSLLHFVVFGFFVMCVFGSIGYAVIFALRKVGVRK